MNKKLAFVIGLVVVAAILAGCGSSGGLGEGFEEEAVKTAAQDAVTTLNSGDYEAFCALGADSVKDALTPEVIESAVTQVMPEAGAFVKFSAESITGQKDSNDHDCAVAVLVAEYENQRVTYTISFDSDMKLIGFYLK